jgi:hypothetical protein
MEQPTQDPLSHVPPGRAFVYVAEQTKIPCHTLFLAAAGSATKNKMPANERLDILEFARAACRSKNPDVLWQIALVESSFRMKVVQIGGKEALYGEKAVAFVEQGLPAHMNVDLGPLQVNWRANGSKYSFHPKEYFKGQFAVDFVSDYLAVGYLRDCGPYRWIQCYHSYNPERGTAYGQKIWLAGLQLRGILTQYLP